MMRQYNSDNGQIFYEQQLSASSLKHRLASKLQDWSRYPPSSTRGTRQNRLRVRGPKSLKTLALEVCSENIGSIERDILLGVPEHLLWDIWDSINSPPGKVPFQAWKVFVSFLSKGKPHGSRTSPRNLWRYRLHIEEPGAPFTAYIQPLKSNKFDFIVQLTIAGGTACTSSELLVLPTMSNLGVLEIIQPQDLDMAAVFPRVTDSILREWSHAAAEQIPPFPSLRILKVWGQDFTTHRSLEYATKLPSLAIYDVAGREEDWQWDDAQYPTWICKVERYGLDDQASIEHLSTTLAKLKETERTEQDLRLAESYVSLPRDGEFVFVSAAGISKTIGPIHEDYKFETDKDQHARKHYGMYTKESQAYVIYSQLGKLWADRDLRVQGRRVPEMVTVQNELVLPSLPYASVVLGSSSDVDVPVTRAALREHPNLKWRPYGHGDVVLAHNVFIRPSPWRQTAAPIPPKRKAEKPNHSRSSKKIKRQGIDALLSNLYRQDSSRN